MAIPQDILTMTNAAFQDGVLTYSEIEKITAEALRQGVPKDEIKEYLDKTLQESLLFYPKDALRECPRCKSRTPNSSPKCLFCGFEPEIEIASTQNEPQEITPPPYDPSTIVRVPRHIVDLTELALQDRILTFKERQTIVKEALDMGVDVAVVNKYIDDALNERLKSYHKEDLKRCPTCGAQIPLISDECLFCGNSLTATDGERMVVPVDTDGVTGYAADIIRDENRKTAEYQQSIAQCPDCGAALPLVSHICTYCGHILHEQTGSQYNIQQILHNINESIRALRSAPKPGFFKILTYNIDVAMAIIGAIITVNVDADTSGSLVGKGVWYVFGFVILAASPFVGMFLNMKSEYSKDDKENLYKTSPIELADQAFYNALAMFDSYTLQIATLYGNNSEAKTELGYLDKLIKEVKKERAKHRAGVAAVYVGVVALIIIIKYMSL